MSSAKTYHFGLSCLKSLEACEPEVYKSLEKIWIGLATTYTRDYESLCGDLLQNICWVPHTTEFYGPLGRIIAQANDNLTRTN